MNNTSTWGRRRVRLPTLVATLGLALTACGGGGGDGGGDGGGTGSSGFITNNAVNANAGESSANFVAAVRQVVALGEDEKSEPLSLQGVNEPPEDNSSEPVSL